MIFSSNFESTTTLENFQSALKILKVPCIVLMIISFTVGVALLNRGCENVLEFSKFRCSLTLSYTAP